MNKYLKGTIIMVLFLLPVFLTSLFSTVSVLEGYVEDKKTGEPIAKVKIKIVFLKNTSVRFQLETDEKGYFYQTGLKNGMYQVNFDKEGYTPAQRTIRLIVAEQREMDIRLEPIEVTASETSFGLVTAAGKLMTAGKYDEAIEKVSQAIEKAIEKDPGIFILYYNRAVAYEKIDETEKAVLDYEKSLELKPDFLLSLSALGNIYARKADFPGAVKYFQKAFELGITDTVVLYNYGACLINLGENDRGKTVFEKLIELDPNYADAYYQLGIIHLGMNDNIKAREFLEKFIELDPGNSNAALAREILNTLN